MFNYDKLYNNVVTERYSPIREEFYRILNPYSEWIVNQLHLVSAQDAVVLGADPIHGQRDILKISDLMNFVLNPGAESPIFEYVDFPCSDNTPKEFYAERIREKDGSYTWLQDDDISFGPVAIKYRNLDFPIVFITTQGFIGNTSEVIHTTRIILDTSNVDKFLNFISSKISSRKFITTYPGRTETNIPVDGYDWSKVILSTPELNAIKDEFENFLDDDLGKNWYAEMQLIWKRGYLFYGPPGNGKTSTIRIMASHPKVNAFSFDLMDQNATNGKMTDMFRSAVEMAPSVVMMEDLDRAFMSESKTNMSDGKITNISIQHFLNVMDGVASNEGVVVIATANDLSKLDPAITSRPGRFDSRVLYKNPNKEGVIKFLNSKNSLSKLYEFEKDLIASAVTGSNFSFAQLTESYYNAAMQARDNKLSRVVTCANMEYGIQKMIDSLTDLKKFKGNLGF